MRIAIPARLLNVHKGQALVLEMLSEPKWRAQPIHVSLYGDGPDRDQYAGFIAEHALESVSIHERVPDMLDIWRTHHAIMLPSFMEGLPIVLVAAMLCARVPIVPDVRGPA